MKTLNDSAITKAFRLVKQYVAEHIAKINPRDVGAAAASHNHSAPHITSGTIPIARGGTGATNASSALSNLGAVPKSGGTMTGPLVAQTNTSYTTAQMRNIIISTADPSGGNNGDIWLKYEA